MYIIDFEASSLRKSSYPIEVAWGESKRSVRSYLLNPENMNNWTDWSLKSYEFHKIPRENLLKTGTDPKKVAKHLVEELAGKPVYSDEPRYDNMWKNRLLADTGYDPELIKIKNLKYFLNKIIKKRFPGKLLEDLFQEFATIKTPNHRAGADVIWLFYFVEFIQGLTPAK